MAVKILDCTLRDGGYYNKWDFDDSLVKDYLHTMSACNVDYVELGLRQFNNNQYLGPHAYTTSQYLERLQLPKGPSYGVMIDAKTILSEERPQEESIDLLFDEAEEEKICFVRVAAHFKEVKKCLPMLSRLKQKGYTVGLNIMHVSLRSKDEIAKLSKILSNWDFIDVLYFADSLGSMVKTDIEMTYESISKHWKGEIGFHAHNNLGKAVSNVSVAAELGATWIDVTVSGMGRGAGNAETEFILMDEALNNSKVDHSGLFNLVNKHFKK